MTPEQIAKLRELLSKATPGPWGVEDPLGPEILSIIANPAAPVYQWEHIAQLSADNDSDEPPKEQQIANAALIVAMHEALPDLLSAIEGQGEREKIVAWLQREAADEIHSENYRLSAEFIAGAIERTEHLTDGGENG